MCVKKYRKKPVTVDAIHFTDESFPEVIEWCANNGVDCELVIGEDGIEGIVVDSLEGRVTGSVGCYVIQGIKGEMYICDEQIFNELYEEVGPGDE